MAPTSRRAQRDTRTERAIWTAVSLSVIALLLAALLLLVEGLDRLRAEPAPTRHGHSAVQAPEPRLTEGLELCAPAPSVHPPLRAGVRLASRTAQGL